MDLMTRRRMLFAHIKKLVHRTITSANGLVSFKSNVEIPLKITCEFSPIQGGKGDPSPENQRPISGWGGCEIPHTGKNLVPDFNVTYEFWSSGWLNKSGGISPSGNPYITSEFIQIKAGSSYIFSTNSSGWKCNAFFDENKRIISGTYKETNSGTAPQNAKYIRISFAPNRSGTTYLPTTVQLELGSTATDYEPYQGEAITISWKLPDEYQEVEYLESNGNQYFYSDIDIQDGLTVDSVQSYNRTADMYLFGGYVTNGRSTFNGGWNDRIEGGYPSSYYLTDTKLDKTINTVYHIVTTHANGTITVYRDENLIKNTSGLASIEADGSKCAVFGNRPAAGGEPNYKYNGRVYSLKVSKNMTMLADFVPCYRKSDNKPGMYDLVTSTFYINQGTGDDFTVGPDASTLPGTVYGGTVTLNEDGSADLAVTRLSIEFDGSADEAWKFETTVNHYKNAYIAMPSTFKTLQTTSTEMICSASPTSVTKSGTLYRAEKDACYISSGKNFNFCWLDTLGIFNANDFKAWLQDGHSLQVVATLINPITYHFDNIGQLQSFLGTNNIWHNMNGSITAEYWNKQ